MWAEKRSKYDRKGFVQNGGTETPTKQRKTNECCGILSICLSPAWAETASQRRPCNLSLGLFRTVHILQLQTVWTRDLPFQAGRLWWGCASAREIDDRSTVPLLACGMTVPIAHGPFRAPKSWTSTPAVCGRARQPQWGPLFAHAGARICTR